MSKLRVKLYRLDEDGEWDDRGPGLLSLLDLEQSEEPGLYVIGEDDDTQLLRHRITAETSYTKQEDTIIRWIERDPYKAELALSFQESAGCSDVWNHISSTQRILHLNSRDSKTNLNVNSELRELPNVNLCTLPQILKIVERGITDQMPLTELLLKDVDFFKNLMAVFQTYETSKNLDGLHMMFKIVKGIILLNSSQILEIILGDQLIMKIVGCLEYNPDVPQSQDSQHHRNYLREHVVFKEAIPIKDPLVLSKIHQTFRIGYLKDNVLHDVLDEDTSAKLKSAMDTNIVSITTLLQNDSKIIQELFERLRSPSTSVESRNNLVDFLHEFCRLCKSPELSLKQHIFRKLTEEGIFDIIADVVQSPDKKLVLTGIDILSLLLDQDPTLLRSYVLRSETRILDFLVKGMMEDFGEKMQCQFVDLIQEILECGGYQQQARVMEILCEKHIPVLVDFITAPCPGNSVNSSEDAAIRVGSHCGATPEVLLRICEFLCFSVRLLTSRKNFLLKDVTLTRRKDVVAAAIRGLRTLLSPSDDNVHRYIVEKNMLKPIIDVFVVDGHRDNLLNSAILVLLQHKCKGRQLLNYVVEEFLDQLAPFEDLDLKTQSIADPVDEPALHEQENSAYSSSAEQQEAQPHHSYVAASSSTQEDIENNIDAKKKESTEKAAEKKAKRAQTKKANKATRQAKRDYDTKRNLANRFKNCGLK